MRKIFFLLGAFIAPILLQAQQQKLSIEDAVIGQWTKFYPKQLAQLQWLPGSDAYIHETEDNKAFLRVNISGNTDTLVKISAINDALTRIKLDELKRLPRIEQLFEQHLRFIYQKKLLSFYWKTSSITIENEIPNEAENVDIHKNGTIAFTKESDLYLIDDAQITQVTREEAPGIVNGQAAHRQEFGITKGTFWSNKGEKIAFYRMDERPVTEYPILDLTKTPAQSTPIRYPMAGQASHHVTVGVYNINEKRTVFLEHEGDPEQYWTNITWSPDDRFIYVALVNRDQNKMQLCQFESTSGKKVKVVFEEVQDKYVEPEHGPIFIPGKESAFVWLSERDGYNHLYQYDKNGNYIRPLTSGQWVITDVSGFDETGQYIYFTATAANPLERHFYRLSLTDKKMEQLTKASGTHNTLLHPGGEVFLDQYSNYETPNKVLLSMIGKKKIKRTELLSSPNYLKNYALGEMKVFPITAKDGTPLYCRMILPPDFDTAKKYPTIVYVYGGPHAQMIGNRWLGKAALWMQYAAQEGFIVFTLDNRGSSGRGLAFEQATFRNLGTVEVEDQLSGVKYLSSLPYVDTARIGVYGWSFGGFMATSLMLKHPDIFKVGVAGGPVIDWSMYEVMYTERYMDRPQDNPEGYKASNLLNYADQLKGKLLLIHGTSDNVVLWQHSLKFIENCIEKRKQVDYFVYPLHEHNVRGYDRIHLKEKIIAYFKLYL